jgi:hypothetical protein
MTDYMNPQALLEGINTMRVWEMLSMRMDVARLTVGVPLDFADWITAEAAELRQQFSAVEAEVFAEYREFPFHGNDTERAAALAALRYGDIVTRIIDGQGYATLIWEQVKPAAPVAYRDTLAGVDHD